MKGNVGFYPPPSILPLLQPYFFSRPRHDLSFFRLLSLKLLYLYIFHNIPTFF